KALATHLSRFKTVPETSPLLSTAHPITARQRSQFPLVFSHLALWIVSGKNRTHLPSERQLPGEGRCERLPSSSVQSRANGAWGPHTPATTVQLSLYTCDRDTVSCPWSCRQEKQSCRTNILQRNTRTYRRGTAQELRDTQTFRQHSSRVETHSRSTQTNTPTGTVTYTQSSGEGTVGRSHERIRQPLCVTGIPFPHNCREPVSLGKARAGSGSSPPSGWSPPWSTTGFSSPGEQGTLRRAFLHLRKESLGIHTSPPTTFRTRSPKSEKGPAETRQGCWGPSASGTPLARSPSRPPPSGRPQPEVRAASTCRASSPRPARCQPSGQVLERPRHSLTSPRVWEGAAQKATFPLIGGNGPLLHK
uniref:Uncharacterized protein n=1 Tax=Mustela putorius furo TaxID=9669 RepID=M3YDA4_MUSPF